MIISMTGVKGGIGKTLLSHVFCRGILLACKGKSEALPTVILGVTDQRNLVLNPEGRGYLSYDCREEGAFQALLEIAAEDPDAVIVLDGGANRLTHDKILYEAAQRFGGLSFIPFMPDEYDWSSLKDDAALYPDAFLIKNTWPTRQSQADTIEAAFQKDCADLSERVAMKIPVRSGFKKVRYSPVDVDAATDRQVKQIGEDLVRLMRAAGWAWQG